MAAKDKTGFVRRLPGTRMAAGLCRPTAASLLTANAQTMQFYSIIVITVFCSMTKAQQTNSSDAAALTALAKSLSPLDLQAYGWNMSVDPCGQASCGGELAADAPGRQCNWGSLGCSDFRVISLSLRPSTLTPGLATHGKLPAILSNLQYLRTLSLPAQG